MNRAEIRDRARFLYADELQYALARDEEVLTESVRERATLRLTREMEGQEVFELCRGLIDSVGGNVERRFVVDLGSMQLRLGGAIRTDDMRLVPVGRARVRDWIAFDDLRERSFQDHAAKRTRERDAIEEIIARLNAAVGDPTTFEVCPDLFASDDAA